MTAFAHKGARDFDDGYWSRLIHEGSTDKRLEYCQDKDGNLCYFRAFQGHSGGIPRSPALMKYTLIPYDWKKYFYHRGSQGVFQSLLVSGIIPGGKEEDKVRQAVFLNPFGKRPGRGEASFRLHSSSKKFKKKPNGNAIKNTLYWVRLKEAQDQGLEFWQTKSCAIVTYVTVPGDCIDRVTVQNGDRVLFERLATPMSAPKAHVEVELAKPAAAARAAARSSPFHTQTYLVSGNRATWESKAEVQDDSKYIEEADQVPGNRQQFTSQMDVDTHLSNQEVSTNALVKNEAVKEELTDTNTKAIERIKIGPDKICFREDMAKEKIVFSQRSYLRYG